MSNYIMNVKDTLEELNATSNDVIVFRDNGTESRCPYCGPYKKLIENKYDKKVEDFWREDYTIIVILLNEEEREK